MKKLFALVLAILMVLSIAACGAKTEAPAVADQTDAADDTPAVKTVTPGVLTVAISPDFAPMEFVDTEGNFAGFDVMLAQFIADEMGLELVIAPMSFDACQTAVSMGTVDMSISGFSWTEKRAANYNLSDWYHAGENEDNQTLICLAENAGKFTTPESLAGLKVGAQGASLQEELVKDQLPGCELIPVADLNTAIMQLQNGDFDVLAVAEGNGKAIIANNPQIAMAGFFFEVDEKYTDNLILMQKGNDELTALVNEILAKSEEHWEAWYAEAQATAGIDVSYDDEGNVIE